MWSVTAGVVPGADEKNYTRSWCYTSDDYAEDRNVSEENCQIMMRNSESEPGTSFPDAASAGVEGVKDTKFMILRDRAFDYAKEIMDPAKVNWVHVHFIWY